LYAIVNFRGVQPIYLLLSGIWKSLLESKIFFGYSRRIKFWLEIT
jgi:hypothetical protein